MAGSVGSLNAPGFHGSTLKGYAVSADMKTRSISLLTMIPGAYPVRAITSGRGRTAARPFTGPGVVYFSTAAESGTTHISISSRACGDDNPSTSCTLIGGHEFRK